MALIVLLGTGAMVLVLLRVDSEALGDEINLDSVNMLDQTGNRRHELLHDIPVDICLKGSATRHDFIEAVGGLLERKLLAVLSHTASFLFLFRIFLLFANDIADEIVD